MYPPKKRPDFVPPDTSRRVRREVDFNFASSAITRLFHGGTSDAGGAGQWWPSTSCFRPSKQHIQDLRGGGGGGVVVATGLKDVCQDPSLNRFSHLIAVLDLLCSLNSRSNPPMRRCGTRVHPTRQSCRLALRHFVCSLFQTRRKDLARQRLLLLSTTRPAQSLRLPGTP